MTQPQYSTDPVTYVRKVGKGKTLLKSLERGEAAFAFDLLLRGAFTASQAGAFLQALRIKELTSDELDGLMDCLRARQPAAVPSLPEGGFVLNLASDTPRKGGYASLLAAAALAAEGLPVGIVRSEPVFSGNTASWDGTFALVRGAGHDAGHAVAGCCAFPHAPAALCVVEANDLVPDLRSLRGLRGELGFRSCLHTAEKLLNPWPRLPLVLGISHRHYAERMSDHFARRGQKAFIVLGNHGTPDLVLHKETEVWEVGGDGAVRTVSFHPGELGLAPEPGIYTLGAFADWARELESPGCGALGPVLDYHLAFLRYVAGQVSHPREHVPRFVSTTSAVRAGASGEVA